MKVSCCEESKKEPDIRMKIPKDKLRLKSQTNETVYLTGNGVSPDPQGKPKPGWPMPLNLTKSPSLKTCNTALETVLSSAGILLSSLASLSSSQLFSAVADDPGFVDQDIFTNYVFPFENLIFEGGGNKGMAYVGALKVLEVHFNIVVIL